MQNTFKKVFQQVVEQICADDLDIELHLFECAHAGRPAWAQNDAMMEGYLDGGEYFYRLNDDTQMKRQAGYRIISTYLNTTSHPMWELLVLDMLEETETYSHMILFIEHMLTSLASIIPGY